MLRYAITNRLRLAASEPDRRAALLEHARRCAVAGVDFLQLREKDLPARELADIARAMLEIIRGQHAPAKTRLLINSRADVAVAARADGVHLTSGEGELTPAQVRSLYDRARLPELFVSISCHTLTDVTRARELGASLVLFGPVFEKAAVAHTSDIRLTQGTGLDLLHTICTAAAPIQVLALGGVTEGNAPECLEAGAAGIAGIRLFAS